MANRYPHLAAPGRIGTLELRNRMLMCPIGDSLGHSGGTVSDRQAGYFEARARGGAAMLIVGSVAVAYPAGCYDSRQLGISDDAFLPGLRDLTDRAHRHGAAIAVQLVHDGQNSLLDIAEGRPLLIPSETSGSRPDRLSMMLTTAELQAATAPFQKGAVSFAVASDEDIARVVESFATAALRAQAAGFDGIEIHAGHGYLIDSFLSPASNHRTDAWGGPIEQRARLLCDVIREVRAAVPLPVWCRINAVEHFRPGGESIADGVRVAQLAVEAGAAAVHVSAYADRGAALGVTEAHTPHRPGALVENAARIKAVVGVPVITFGRLSPDDAEAALARGDADFVAMGRKLLADPDLPAKVLSGRVDDIRPCIYQYRCIGNIFVGDSVSCVVNAATGSADMRGPVRAGVLRRVLVVGGGAGGLEAARLLTVAGHEVTLWDAHEEVGGQLTAAAQTDDALAAFLTWLIRQCIDVTTILGREAAPQDALGFDEVVVATGGSWQSRWPATLPIADLLAGRAGERVAILGGGKPGLSLAAWAGRRGHRVTVLEPTAVFGTELGLPGRFRMVHEVREIGVELVPDITVTGVTAHGVTHEGGFVEADSVVSALAYPADPALVDGIRALGITAHVVGDCGGYRGIEGAMLDAAAVSALVGGTGP